MELKIGHTPEEALSQIRERKYALKFEGETGRKSEMPRQDFGGIAYVRETKAHSCKAEVPREAL